MIIATNPFEISKSKIMLSNYNNSKRKRVVDVFFSVIALLFLLVIFPLIYVGIKFDSKGPVLYKRDRLGVNAKRFHLIKFRTMAVGSDLSKSGLRTKNFDNRVTRIGRLLRRTYLDEFPQFWNVLIGQMSIVGPRPEFPELYSDLEKISPNFRDRMLIKPGITGLAQIKYKHAHNDIEAAGRLVYDIEYISSASLFGDIKIILETLKRSIKLRGS